MWKQSNFLTYLLELMRCYTINAHYTTPIKITAQQYMIHNKARLIHKYNYLVSKY